jgi:CheY-like chemotaxis protein
MAASSPAVGRASPRVLVVDDCALNRKLLAAILTHRQVPFEEASDGREALARLEAGIYGLVLMDVQMPVMNGREATAEFRRLRPDSRLPIIAVTASLDDMASVAGGDFGFTGVIGKPISIAAVDGLLAQYARSP